MKKNETVLVPLAEGFEEIEAVTIIDVLRRAEVDVTVAGLAPGPVRGAHGVCVEPDSTLDAVDPARIHMVVLPGGMPGTTHLMEDQRLLELLRRLDEGGHPTAAICAAPMVLREAGLLAGRRATAYPSCQDALGPAEVDRASRVVRDGKLLTSQGPGTALEFALALVGELVGPERAAELASEMVLAPGLAPA